MRIFTDDYGDLRLFWCTVLAVSAIAGLILLIATIVRQFDYHYTSTYCDDKLAQVSREGKFVEYNFWEYECLAKTKNGTYIPLKNLYNNVQENNVQ